MNINTYTYSELLKAVNKIQPETALAEQLRPEYKFIRMNENITALEVAVREMELRYEEASLALSKKMLASLGGGGVRSCNPEWKATRHDVGDVEAYLSKLISEQTETLIRVAFDSNFSADLKTLLGRKDLAHNQYLTVKGALDRMREGLDAVIRSQGGVEEVETKIDARCFLLRDIAYPSTGKEIDL